MRLLVERFWFWRMNMMRHLLGEKRDDRRDIEIAARGGPAAMKLEVGRDAVIEPVCGGLHSMQRFGNPGALVVVRSQRGERDRLDLRMARSSGILFDAVRTKTGNCFSDHTPADPEAPQEPSRSA